MKRYISISIIALFFSCGSNIIITNTKISNNLEILKHLEKNKIKAQKSSTGLYYVITKRGKGRVPHKKSKITAYYKGTFLNGRVFDKSDFRGITFNLQEVISGWQEGFTYLKSGSEATFFIPSHLAYGIHSTTRIPGGSVLIFKVKLISVY